MEEVLKSMTNLLKGYIEDLGGSVEFDESVIIVGQYGDRAGAKYFFLHNGKLYAHVYNCWMENVSACLEYSMLSEETLRMLISRVEKMVA